MGYHASGALGTHARRPISRYDRGISSQRRVNPVPSLADDIDFLHRAQWGLEHLDDDREAFTCPDWIDQTRSPLSAFACLLGDDAEPDDEDTGVDDEPHDPREEDGL